jgi:hypothetical protein
MMTMSDTIDVQDLPAYLHASSEHSERASVVTVGRALTAQAHPIESFLMRVNMCR